MVGVYKPVCVRFYFNYIFGVKKCRSRCCAKASCVKTSRRKNHLVPELQCINIPRSTVWRERTKKEHRLPGT